MRMTTDAFARLAQDVDSRRYGKFRGFVSDNDDPEKRGRLKLTVPSTLDEQTTDWALPCAPFGGSDGTGLLLIPEVGAEVWVEFEQGDISRPIWVGAMWTKSPDEGGVDLGSPTARTLRTPGGQILRMDDEEDRTGITLHHQSGAEITIADDGTLDVKDGQGEVITLDAANGKVLVEDANGNTVTLSSSGITLDDGQGGSVAISSGAITIKGTSITLDAPSVSLGGSGGEGVLKGTSFLSAFAAHTHPSAMGPTGPPIPTTEQMAVSQKVTSG